MLNKKYNKKLKVIIMMCLNKFKVLMKLIQNSSQYILNIDRHVEKILVALLVNNLIT